MPCYVQPFSRPSQADYEQWKRMGYLGSWDQYCQNKAESQGGRFFICGELGPHCAECLAVGDFLCDYPVGEGKTCDRPLCDTHGHEIGRDLHYCQAHYEMWQEFKAKGGVDEALRNVIAFKNEK